MDLPDVVAAWRDAAANDDLRRPAIHPLGTDEDAYLRSGAAMASTIAELAPPSGYPKIGDFGCGDGRVARWLPRFRYGRVVAADAAAEMLDHVPTDEGIETVASTGVDGRLPLLDCWYTSAVVIHHSFADGAAILKALASATHRDGLVLFDAPLYDVARERTSWVDVTVWTEAMLLQACEAAGLDVEVSWTNPGHFSFQAIGANHGRFHVLRRR